MCYIDRWAGALWKRNSKVSSLTYNGTDVTALLDSNLRFTVPAILSNALLNVVYEQSGLSGVRLPKQDGVKVNALSDGRAQIVNVSAGTPLDIYTVGGALVTHG